MGSQRVRHDWIAFTLDLLATLKVEKIMAPHSSTLAWKIPWMEGPGGLQSMGSRRVGHDWVTLLSLFAFTRWRRKWQPTPVFLPGESQGRESLVGCCLWGRIELETTEGTQQQQSLGLLGDPEKSLQYTTPYYPRMMFPICICFHMQSSDQFLVN